jgi:hypothetical protein
MDCTRDLKNFVETAVIITQFTPGICFGRTKLNCGQIFIRSLANFVLISTTLDSCHCEWNAVEYSNLLLARRDTAYPKGMLRDHRKKRFSQ